MSGYLGRATNTFRDVTGAYVGGEREDMVGNMPGRVTGYDAVTMTVSVQPLVSKRDHEGNALNAPELSDVPLDLPRGAGGSITFPVKVGDRVTLTPSMRDMGAFDTGEGQGGTRSFNLSDVRATLTGGDPLSDPLPNVDPDNLHIRFGPSGDYGIKGSPDGKLRIDGAEGNAFAMIAAAVRLLAGAQTIVSGGSSAGSYDHDQKAAVLALADKLDGMAL